MKENYKNIDARLEGAVISNVPENEPQFREAPTDNSDILEKNIAEIGNKSKEVEAILNEKEKYAQIESKNILTNQSILTQQEGKTAFNIRKEERLNKTKGSKWRKWFKRFMLAGGLFLAGSAGAKAGEKAVDSANMKDFKMTTTVKSEMTPEAINLASYLNSIDGTIKVPENYKPSTPKERANWNNFIKFLVANKVAGSKDLDLKDKSLGLSYLKKYNLLNPDAQVSEDFILRTQFEHKLMRRHKIMPFMSKAESDLLVSYMPNALNKTASDDDNWLGSITSTEFYPEIVKHGDSYGGKVYNFGANYSDFLKFQNEKNTENLSKIYAKYVVDPNNTQPTDVVAKNK